MALRLVEVMLPSDRADMVTGVLEEPTMVGPWHETLNGGLTLVRFVVDAERTGPVIDALNQRFGHHEQFQVLMLPVSATLPRIEEQAEAPGEDGAPAGGDTKAVREAAAKQVTGGLSREELHQQVVDMMKLSPIYIAMVLLSGVVATLGMMRDNVAVIIGAMVIAPLLGPNVALAFAATIGDTPLLKRTLVTNVMGISLSMALAAACALLVPFDPATPEIAARTHVELSDIALALASGAAGAIAITTGVPAALVGVMVAVALLPPTVAVGLMLGSAHWALAGGAVMLLAVNVICVNLAGVVTFLVQGIRPRMWWERERARKSATLALGFWIAALLAIVAIIVGVQYR